MPDIQGVLRRRVSLIPRQSAVASLAIVCAGRMVILASSEA